METDVFHATSNPGGQGAPGAEAFKEFFGPGHVDQAVRSAIQICWMALPKPQRSPENVETEIRRIVERALRDFREDAEKFGMASGPETVSTIV